MSREHGAITRLGGTRRLDYFGSTSHVEASEDREPPDEAREALLQLDPIWDELFPAEQARIVQPLVERVDLRCTASTFA